MFCLFKVVMDILIWMLDLNRVFLATRCSYTSYRRYKDPLRVYVVIYQGNSDE